MRSIIGAVSIFVCALVSSEVLAMKADESVLNALSRNAKEISVVIHLKGNLDLKALSGNSEAVVSALEKFNHKSADTLRQSLRAANLRGISEITPLWLTNSIRIKGTPETIKSILAFNVKVDNVILDAPLEVSELQDQPTASLSNRATRTGWGIEKLNADKVWQKGITGKGIVVAVIDSGANYKHPDLQPNLWQNPGEMGQDTSGKDKTSNGIDDDANGYVDDTFGWNFEDKTNGPSDVNGHGSQTAGIVGGMGAGGTQTGVAPGASLMILRACCNSANQTTESNIWEAMQYAIKNKARVISMSLSIKHPSKPSYAKWRKASEVMLAAGVIHINSAGNRGSSYTPFNVGAPANNPPAWFHPKQPIQPSGPSSYSSMITIGATSEEDQIRDYSSTGPVTWEAINEYKDFPYDSGAKTGLVRPDVCGPSEVPSTSMTGSGYTQGFGGTSSATPHIAGVVALILQAKPNLSPAQMTEVLQMSAVKVDTEFNNKCGAGRVDVQAAIDYARSKF